MEQVNLLSGRNREGSNDNDIWELYGKYRGGRLSFDVKVGDDNIIEIELAGGGATALYIAAALIEKPGSNALHSIERQRKE